MPTIAVVATQTGYLVGGLVAIEFLFNYQGIGLMTLTAAEQKDFTLLTAGLVIVGVGFLLVTLVADILFALINPAYPIRDSRVTDVANDRSPGSEARARAQGATEAPAPQPELRHRHRKSSFFGCFAPFWRPVSRRMIRSTTTVGLI